MFMVFDPVGPSYLDKKHKVIGKQSEHDTNTLILIGCILAVVAFIAAMFISKPFASFVLAMCSFAVVIGFIACLFRPNKARNIGIAFGLMVVIGGLQNIFNVAPDRKPAPSNYATIDAPASMPIPARVSTEMTHAEASAALDVMYKLGRIYESKVAMSYALVVDKRSRQSEKSLAFNQAVCLEIESDIAKYNKYIDRLENGETPNTPRTYFSPRDAAAKLSDLIRQGFTP